MIPFSPKPPSLGWISHPPTDYREVRLTLVPAEGEVEEAGRREGGGREKVGEGMEMKRENRDTEKGHARLILCQIFCFEICNMKFSVQSPQAGSSVHIRRVK